MLYIVFKLDLMEETRTQLQEDEAIGLLGYNVCSEKMVFNGGLTPQSFCVRLWFTFSSALARSRAAVTVLSSTITLRRN